MREANYGDFTETNSETFKNDNDIEKYINNPFPNGESYKDVEKRMVDFLKDISQKYDSKHIAIVAHQAPQLALDVLLGGKTWERAMSENWRHTKDWKPGWNYIYHN
ncbi:MAG: hypothetical protein A2537_01210 [Candidatus Magasanikbacteria bacterium RIFOXYD2_FULL_36_9]|uniref:Phosphoglycerate mutase n=1 Tax=Candidatus Magasanikbacteria bacterium RIFOXYD2_FULL_36_9 TaxID=1798707 RepID=A0A1F6NYP5_9BACT|nr:MAG: hypothetical protein A2537_01210 [Candidatus Magasanikbacteria bacterium RIFOXYD2_FULL_36_9]